MPFGLPLRFERIPGTKNFKLLRDYVYHWERKHKIIVVPVGYITDQASVPSFVLPLIVDNTGKITDAAIPHDFGYTDLSKQGWSRADVDLMFRDAMLEAGMNRIRVFIAWSAVRLNLKAAYNWGK